ncbi:MAG: hypothetical protein WED00_16940 [Aquisalimonadaceae bacterium]
MTRQRINLHQPPPRRVDLLSTTGMVWLVAGLVLALTLVSASLAWQAAASEEATADLAASVRSMEDGIARMRADLPPAEADRALTEAANERDRRLATGEHLLAGLGARISEPSAGFSSVLASLAREPLDGVWLERIVIGREGGLLFEGQAVNADRIPLFVERLGREPELIGREFSTLRIERPATDARSVSFSLIGVGVGDERDR